MDGVVVLGCTGSVGTNALEVLSGLAEPPAVVGLAGWRNVPRLAEQTRRFAPEIVAVADDNARDALVHELAGGPAGALLKRPEIVCGADGLCTVASIATARTVVNAIVGAAGLRPTLAALTAQKRLVLANKESLVIAGRLCMETAARHGAALVPVDSEHSAVVQLLAGRAPEALARVILTGSGGPLRDLANHDQVTVAQVLAHPTWAMGPRISVDSASLMNKGFEIIEAHVLFGLPQSAISVVIHRESIVHAMVELVDGTVLAQLSPADMRIPLGYALLGEALGPRRPGPGLSFPALSALHFEAPDLSRFPCLGLARQALEQGGTYPAVLNAADEVAVAAFLDQRLPFAGIPNVVASTLTAHRGGADGSAEEIMSADHWARRTASEHVTAVARAPR